jgi:hypothetical protein
MTAWHANMAIFWGLLRKSRRLEAMPYMPECIYERPPPLVLSGIPGRLWAVSPRAFPVGLVGRPGDAGGGVALGDETAGLAAPNGLFVTPRKRGSRGTASIPQGPGFPLARE